MIHSILNPIPVLDPATKKRITITQLVGIPLILALFLLVCVSVLTDHLPAWVGAIALGAQSYAASLFIRKIQSLRSTTAPVTNDVP